MTSPNQPRQFRPQSASVAGIGYLIIFSRWLQSPLGLIDVVMISNLLIMVIIGISSIHLLKTFIEVNVLGAPAGTAQNETGETYTADGIFWQVTIHMVFIVSAVALAWIDGISQGSSSSTRSMQVTPRNSNSLPLPQQANSPVALSSGIDPDSNEARALHYEQLAKELRAR